MSAYKVISESEEDGCWIYRFEACPDGVTTTVGRLRLAWADYDLWIPDGTVEPARVADAILRFVLENSAFQPIPDRIDSSHPRRLVSDADQRIIHLIRNCND